MNLFICFCCWQLQQRCRFECCRSLPTYTASLYTAAGCSENIASPFLAFVFCLSVCRGDFNRSLALQLTRAFFDFPFWWWYIKDQLLPIYTEGPKRVGYHRICWICQTPHSHHLTSVSFFFYLIFEIFFAGMWFACKVTVKIFPYSYFWHNYTLNLFNKSELIKLKLSSAVVFMS